MKKDDLLIQALLMYIGIREGTDRQKTVPCPLTDPSALLRTGSAGLGSCRWLKCYPKRKNTANINIVCFTDKAYPMKAAEKWGISIPGYTIFTCFRPKTTNPGFPK